MAEANILNATTIPDLIAAINTHYGTDFQDSFPENSPLFTIWNTNIAVTTSDRLDADFVAEGELQGFPFNFADQVEDHTFTIKAKIAIVRPIDST